MQYFYDFLIFKFPLFLINKHTKSMNKQRANGSDRIKYLLLAYEYVQFTRGVARIFKGGRFPLNPGFLRSISKIA
jgi:hypothetical protein